MTRERAMSGTIPSMEEHSENAALTDNTIIVGERDSAS